jgi:putative oxidoreductase
MEIMNKKYIGEGLGLLRIAFGLMLVLAHGWPTLNEFVAGNFDQYPNPLGIGPGLTMGLMVFAEFFCALAVTLGVFTRLALIPLIIGFATAFFIHHAGDPFGHKELSFHYFLVFVVLLLTGPGKFSITSLWKKQE